MATKPETKTNGPDDPLHVMKTAIETAKANADVFGVKQWRQLRDVRRDLNALIARVEGRPERKSK